MDRRKFFKNLGKALLISPFLFAGRKEASSFCGIDKGGPEGDYTSILLFNNVSREELKAAKEKYYTNHSLDDYAKALGIKIW